MEIESLRMFKSVTHYMSITQAAFILDISQPSLSRRMKQLEDDLSVKLFHRTGGRIELTPQGARFLKSVEKILTEHDSVRDEISSDSNDVKGHVSLGIAHPMARWLSEEFIAGFCNEYPNTHVNLVTINPKDMVKMANCDIMISPILPEDTALIARKVHEFSRFFCASHEYLRLNGTPLHPDDFANHQCIVNASVNKNEKSWKWHDNEGNDGVSKIIPAISTDSIDIAASLARKGMGIASLPESQIEHHFESGELKELFNTQYYQKQSLYLVYRTREFMPLKHKQLIESLNVFYAKQQQKFKIKFIP